MSIHIHVANGDVPALAAELLNGVSVEARDEQGRTPLMIAAESPKAGSATLRVLLDHGAEVNALSAPQGLIELDEETRATMKEMGVDTSIYDPPKEPPNLDSVLSYAAKTATLEKILLLLEAGADVSYVSAKGYGMLTNTMFRACQESAEAHKAIIAALIDAGAPLDVESSYGESALSVASGRGNFAIVAFLVKRGADPGPLGWVPVFHAVAAGNLEAATEFVDAGAALDQRDAWDRTPFLLSVHAGHQEIAQFLLDRGSDSKATGRCGHTALMYAISRDDAAMLRWLIEMSWDIETTDEFGNFPLLQAAQENAIRCVQTLLDADVSVDRRGEYGSGAIHDAASPEVVQLLVAAGEELSDVDAEMRLQLVGNKTESDVDAPKRDYRKNRRRAFGKRNPAKMNNAFWDMMVRTRMSAFAGAAKYGDSCHSHEPVWCFQRHGQSLTRLPDGRYVEIAGEHEDYYDPDFCIYNDVVVHDGNGTFDIFGYPEAVFPPTDFHSATLVGPHIYIIGNLGYTQQRRPGETPVYRLLLESWSIERVACHGDLPGWIHSHKARLVDGEKIAIRGGLMEDGSFDDLVENTNEFVLDLSTFAWRRTR
jgi:ankyrin repeat protein